MLDNAVLLCVPRKTFMCIVELHNLCKPEGMTNLRKCQTFRKKWIDDWFADHPVTCLTPNLMPRTSHGSLIHTLFHILQNFNNYSSTTEEEYHSPNGMLWFICSLIYFQECTHSNVSHLASDFWFWHITISLFDRWTLLKPWQYSEKWKAVH